MRNALTDQLLKAGLVDKKKLKGVKQAKHKQQEQRRKKTAAPDDEVRREAQQAQADKAARDRELNAQRKAEADRRAVEAQIRQLVESNRLEREGDCRFHFTDGCAVKHLYVDAATVDQLGRGRLGIVRFGDGYAIVPAETAEKIAQRDATQLVVLHTRGQAEADDAAYADHPIPDDLMW